MGSGEEEEACGARGWSMAPRVSDEELWWRTSSGDLAAAEPCWGGIRDPMILLCASFTDADTEQLGGCAVKPPGSPRFRIAPLPAEFPPALQQLCGEEA